MSLRNRYALSHGDLTRMVEVIRPVILARFPTLGNAVSVVTRLYGEAFPRRAVLSIASALRLICCRKISFRVRDRRRQGATLLALTSSRARRSLLVAGGEEAASEILSTSARRRKKKTFRDRDCSDFATQDEAQRFLDSDRDGVACEELP